MAERDNRRNDRNREESDGLTKKLIAVNRVTKVVKGGRNMRFSALVVVGDETLEGLCSLRSAEQISKLRGVDVEG